MDRRPTDATISFFRVPMEVIEQLYRTKIFKCVFGIDPSKTNIKEIKVLDRTPDYATIISDVITIAADATDVTATTYVADVADVADVTATTYVADARV